MSLILEALRKLEREKPVAERGFLVVAAPGQDKRRWELLRLLAGVGIGAAAAGLYSWRASVPPAGPAFPAPDAMAAAASAHTPAPAPSIAPPPTAPMVPRRQASAAAQPGEPALVLQAITQQDGRAVALISDRVLREGDEVQGARVVRIGEAEVEIEFQGRRITLRF